MTGLSSRFAAVDSAKSPRFFVDYLDYVRSLPTVMQATRLGVRSLRLATGGRILDVGCGVGTLCAQFAEVVGPAGSVLGIDKSDEMVRECRARHSALPNLRFERRDGAEIDANAYDAIWVERLLMHTPEPERVVFAAVHGLARSGRLVIIEPEWASLLLAVPLSPAFYRWRDHFATRQLHGSVNRDLPAWVRRAGGRITGIERVDFACCTLVEFLRLLDVERIFAAAVRDGAISETESFDLLHALHASSATTPLVAQWPVFVTSIVRHVR